MMNIRNVMEEAVLRVVNEVAQEDGTQSQQNYTTGSQCCTDVACYVLNRIEPKYVSSARGQTYAEMDVHLNPQIDADLLALVHEGFRRITSIQRSFYNKPKDKTDKQSLYNFHLPIIKGRLLHGLTFEPIQNISIQLMIDDQIVAMIDSNWENPYPLAQQTNGLYAFWPQPISAKTSQEEKEFHFELRVRSAEYEALQHSFFIKTISKETKREDLVNAQDFRLPDMYLVPIE